jgi:hypothetical protein
MNWTPLEEAYNVQHSNNFAYSSSILYSSICIYCSFDSSTPLMGLEDGGSFRRCNRCRKNFRAKVLNNAVSNYSTSTSHLKGTN